MWALTEVYVLLGLRSYLEWLGNSQVVANTLILEHITLQVAWHFSPTIISFLIPFSFPFLHSIYVIVSYFSYLLLLGFTHNYEYGASFERPWPPLMFTLCPFQFRKLHLILTISCFSSLPLWSEHSHLLNHLVMFQWESSLGPHH